jgi:WD40 repeat protein
MAREPDDRYADASELASELAHWLDTRWADALTAGARAKSAQQRVVMGVLAVLFVGVASAWGLTQLATERDRAVEAEAVSREAEAAANANLAMGLLAQGRRAVLHNARPEAEVLAVRALELGGSEPDARGVLAAFAMTARPRVVHHFTLPRCEQVALQSDGSRLACRTFEGVSVWDTTSGEVVWERDGDFTSVGWGATSLAATAPTGELHIWDDTGVLQFVRRPNIEVPNLASVAAPLVVNDSASWFLVADIEAQTVSHLSWCPDAVNQVADARLGQVASACNTTVFLSADLSGQPVPYVLPDTASLGVTALRILGPDRILVGTRSGSLRLIAGGELVWSTATEVGAIRRITLDDAGRGFVVGEQATRSFWLHTGLVGERLPSGIDDARVHPDGLLTRSGPEVRVWALPTEEKPRRFKGRGGIADVALTRDGAVLAASSGASETVAWSTSNGEVLGRIDWPDGVGKAVSFNADGTELRATAMGETWIERRTLPGWDRLEPTEVGPRRRIGRVGALTWSLSFSRNSLWVYERTGSAAKTSRSTATPCSTGRRRGVGGTRCCSRSPARSGA